MTEQTSQQDDVKKLHEQAEQGLAAAQYNLGKMYEIKLDYKTAVGWYRRAADQDYTDAQFNLGYMYGKGLGTPRDDKTAVEWFTRAAKQGNDAAQFFLGEAYNNGEGVYQSRIYAYLWYDIATKSGHQRASELRDLVAEQMTPEQIGMAQQLADDMRKKITKGS